MAALAHFMPEQVMACSQGTSAILTLGGVDPRNARHYVSYETVKGGFGARPNKDGINCIASGISNTYYPAKNRGAGLTFENAAIGVGATAAANVLQEFVIRKLTKNRGDAKS